MRFSPTETGTGRVAGPPFTVTVADGSLGVTSTVTCVTSDGTRAVYA